MMVDKESYARLLQEKAELQARLNDAEEFLCAIQRGEVDAMIVSTDRGNRVFTLQSADLPYRLMVEQMQQGAMTISVDGIILFCNQSFADFLGQPVRILVSQAIDKYLQPTDCGAFKTFIHSILLNGSLSQEFKLQAQDEQVIPVYVSGNLLELGDMTVICLIFTDLRKRKQAEQQAIALEMEKQRTKVLANFVRDTSHDLRTPISIVMTTLGNLDRIQDDAKRHEKIHVVEQYVLYLNNVLEQLQQTAMLDSLTALPLQSGRINSLIRDAVSLFEAQAKDKSISMSLELMTDPPSLQFDADSLFRALEELLKNAIRFTPPGGHIRVRTQAEGVTKLKIEVIDNGNGILAENIPHIFERFYKEDGSRSMSGGAGLGLAIVKRIVELHHGTVEVESIHEKVTTFRILLPFTM